MTSFLRKRLDVDLMLFFFISLFLPALSSQQLFTHGYGGPDYVTCKSTLLIIRQRSVKLLILYYRLV